MSDTVVLNHVYRIGYPNALITFELTRKRRERELPNPFSEDHRCRVKAISVSSNERARNILIWDGLKSNGYSKGQSCVKKKQSEDLENFETTISREITSVAVIPPFQHSSAGHFLVTPSAVENIRVYTFAATPACIRHRTSARI